MDLDFPLILVCLVALGIVILVIDAIAWAPSRRQVMAELEKKYPDWKTEGSADSGHFLLAVGEQAKDPLPVEYAKSFLPVLVIVLVLRSFLVEPFQIPSASMVPTLEVGDFILVNKFAYGVRLPVVGTKVMEVGSPQRGDVMVFIPPNDTRYFIKRVIGVPGDQIRYVNKTLYINGEEIPQSLIADMPPGRPAYRLVEEDLTGVRHQVRKEFYRSGPDNFSLTVSPGHYFMMGDNRDNSSDSRVWGLVPEDRVVGKAFAIWMHWEQIVSLPSFDRVGTIR